MRYFKTDSLRPLVKTSQASQNQAFLIGKGGGVGWWKVVGGASYDTLVIQGSKEITWVRPGSGNRFFNQIFQHDVHTSVKKIPPT